MTERQITPEQERRFTEFLNEIGLVGSMRVYSAWLNQQQSQHGPEMRDTISQVAVSLTDATSRLRDVQA